MTSVAESGAHIELGADLAAPHFKNTHEPQFPLPPVIGAMTPGDIMDLQNVFTTLPKRFNENGVPEVDLDTFAVVRNSAHKSAQVIIHEEDFNIKAEYAPDAQKQDLGRSVFRGIRRDPEYYKWVADFSGEDGLEITTHDVEKIELRILPDASVELTPGFTSVISMDKKGSEDRKTSEDPEYKGKLIDGDFEGKNILSLEQFDPESLRLLFNTADLMREAMNAKLELGTLSGTSTALVFYEPSTRTRVSFSQAAQRLGGGVELIENPEAFSSAAKGETLEDTMKILRGYHIDAVVLRHYNKGSAKIAAQSVDIPVINAGDGAGEHPTQALLDLYTIRERRGSLNDITGVLGGDLLNGRTVHSLLDGLSLYKNNRLFLLSPQSLRLTNEQLRKWSGMGLNLEVIESFDDVPKDTDFWYWTRIQKERMNGITDEEYRDLKEQFAVSQDVLDRYGGSTILMHPLPRVGEIKTEVDTDPRAYYFRQATNGLYVRQALLSAVLGRIQHQEI